MGWARQTDRVCGARVGAIIRPPDESPCLTLRIAGSAFVRLPRLQAYGQLAGGPMIHWIGAAGLEFRMFHGHVDSHVWLEP
jgi:hypothetical protein